MSRVAVVGVGYVGLTTAACLADLGNEVIAVDIDADRIDMLREGRLPFYEPGLGEIIDRNRRARRLSFTTDYHDAIPGAEFAFIAVATPEAEFGQADLSYVHSAAKSIAAAMDGHLVIVNKSTVPIGTGDVVSDRIRAVQERHTFDVVSNPEFLREGSAIVDFMQPDRVVIGAHNREAAELVARLYEPLNAPIKIYDLYTAEMVKYASNAFLATRISFINEIARICERVGADARLVAEGMGLDRRIGAHFLDAGIGYGGSCFPKDVKALATTAEEFDLHPALLHAVMDINRDQRRLVVRKVTDCLGGLDGRTIGLLGLAFKPNTDDMREAPSVDIARAFLRGGARVQAYDPAAMARAQRLLPDVNYSDDAYAAATSADALVVVTEWNEFRQLDLQRLKERMRQPILVDGRNIYDPDHVRALGFTYKGIGRN